MEPKFIFVVFHFLLIVRGCIPAVVTEEYHALSNCKTDFKLLGDDKTVWVKSKSECLTLCMRVFYPKCVAVNVVSSEQHEWMECQLQALLVRKCDSLFPCKGCHYLISNKADPCNSKGYLYDKELCTCYAGFYGHACHLVYKDCTEAYRGNLRSRTEVKVMPTGSSSPILASCFLYNGGWTRVLVNDPACGLNFNRTWKAYRRGFSSACGFFMGLDRLRLFTNQGVYTLKIILKDLLGATRSIRYTSFRIGPEEEGFVMDYKSAYPEDDVIGNGFEFVSEVKGQRFHTHDKDFNLCAASQGSGWWYSGECSQANLHLPAGVSEMYNPTLAHWPISGKMVNVQRVDYMIQAQNYYK